MERNTYLTLTEPQEARRLWFAAIDSLDIALSEESVPLRQACGRTLSRFAEALRSSPAFHGAAMDGIAVRAEDTFTASTRTPLRLHIGKNAFWINTGHPLPEGCNAVIMIEHLNLEDGGTSVVTEKAAFPWQHVRKLGEDMVATEILLPSGIKIGPYEIGALAAAGVTRPIVWKKPRVAVIPSGNEIVVLEEACEDDLRSGRCLPEFNSLIFSAMISDAGGEALVRPIVPDDPVALREAVLAAIEDGADLVVVNAGSSAGSHDYTAGVIKDIGDLLVHGVSIMPGKPTALGIVHDTAKNRRPVPIIGAPGYTVSATISMEEFVLPLLSHWLKSEVKRRENIDVYPYNPLPSRPGMEERIRVKLGIVDGICRAVPLPRGAGTVTSLSRADAILRIPKDCEGLNADSTTSAELLRDRKQIEGALLAIGSHDNALDLLDAMLRRQRPGFSLTSAHVGSLGGLIALKRGQCHLAGSHLLDEATGLYNQKAIREQLDDLSVTLVRLADREQGLIVALGNPQDITGFESLARKDIRFINRQKGSGTRLLLDYELHKRNIPTVSLTGYRDEEYTHMSVAAAVLSGRAHVGLGVRAAAVALGLDFIPVGMEEYDLVIPDKFMSDPRMTALLDIIRSSAFKERLAAMGGYGVARTGEIIWRSAQ